MDAINIHYAYIDGDVDPSMNPCSPNLHGAPIPMPWDKRSSARSPPPSSTTLPTSASKSKHTTSYSSQSELPSQFPPPQGPLPLPPQSPPQHSQLPALPPTVTVPLPPTHVRDGSISTRKLAQPHLPASTIITEPHSPIPHPQPTNLLLSSPTRARSMNDITQRQRSQQLDANVKGGSEPGLRSSRSIMDLAKTAHQSVESLKAQDTIIDTPVEEASEAPSLEPVEEPLQIPKKEPKQP